MEPSIGRACVEEPNRMLLMEWSKIVEKVKDKYDINGFVCLGGFRNVRRVYEWKEKSRRQGLTAISLGSEAFQNLSFSLSKAFRHYAFSILCRDEARLSYLKRLSSTLVDGDAYYKFWFHATSSTPSGSALEKNEGQRLPS